MLESGCVYRLTAALPTITRNLTIQGNNDTITRSTGSYTILTNNGASVELNQLRITDAFHTAPGTVAGRDLQHRRRHAEPDQRHVLRQ